MDNYISPISSVSPVSCCSPRNKLICSSAGLVVLVIVAVAAFIFGRNSAMTPSVSQVLPTTIPITATPTLDVTANWKTYSSLKYGFLVKYPSDFSTQSTTDQLGGTTLLFFPPNTTNISITLGQLDKTPSQSFSDWVNSYMKLRDKQTFSIPTNLTVDSRPTIYLESSINSNGALLKSYGYLIQKNDSAVIDIGTNSETTRSTLDQILSTFKFLDQNQAAYISSDLTFKYPADWTKSGDFALVSAAPKIRLVIIPKGNTLMNECMAQTSVETKGTLTIKKFSRVTTGAMCKTADATPREIWVIPSPDAYSPGISFEYSSTQGAQAEAIFNQILSTFKFLP